MYRFTTRFLYQKKNVYHVVIIITFCTCVHLFIQQHQLENTYKTKSKIKIQRKSLKFNALNQAEILSLNIAEYWCMKADNDNSSILSDIQDVIQLQVDLENLKQMANPISEKDSYDSDENKSPDSTQKKLTYYSRDSKDAKKFTNIKLNSSNNFENLDVTSEQQIQQFQNFDHKQNDQINLCVDQQLIQDNKINPIQKSNRNSSNDITKISKNDMTILEADGSDLTQNINDRMNTSIYKKEETSQQKINSFPSVGLIKQNSNKKNSLDINNSVKFYLFNNQDEQSKKKQSTLNSGAQNNISIQNQEYNKEEQKSIIQNLEIQREEDILDNSTTTYKNTLSPRNKNNQSIHHLLIQLRAQKAQQQDENSPKLFSEVDGFAQALNQAQGQCLSPTKKYNSHKKSIISQTSIDYDLHSPEHHKRNHFRKLTTTTKSKQLIPIDSNLSSLNAMKEEVEQIKARTQKKKFTTLKFANDKKNEILFEEKRKEGNIEGGLNEQIVLMNTQNLMNYIQMMQDNQLISPIFDKRISLTDINKRYAFNIMNKGVGSSIGSLTEQELLSPGLKRRQKEKKLSQKNKLSINMISKAIKKNEQIDSEKIKQIQSLSQQNILFPVNEDIIRRHSNELDIDLLIYRKNWRLQMLQNQQMNQLYTDEDNEIDIDIAKNFKIYFPKGNLERVLYKYNKRQISITKKINQHRNTRMRLDSKQFANPKLLQSRLSALKFTSSTNVKKN